GAGAVIATPRAQAATGAAWDGDRAAAIGEILRRYPSVGLIEDDHAGPVAGVPARSAAAGLRRWVTLRSVSKSLGPDLRLAGIGGDEGTHPRVAGPPGPGHRVGQLPAAGTGRGPVGGPVGGVHAGQRGAGVRAPGRGAALSPAG